MNGQVKPPASGGGGGAAAGSGQERQERGQAPPLTSPRPFQGTREGSIRSLERRAAEASLGGGELTDRRGRGLASFITLTWSACSCTCRACSCTWRALSCRLPQKLSDNAPDVHNHSPP